MKKLSIFTIIAMLVSFHLGFIFNDWYYNNDGLYEANQFKTKVINAQGKALDKAFKVMDNNELFDTDGGDDMTDFLHQAAIVDSLCNTQL